VYSRIPFKILIKNVSREDWIIPAGSKIAIAKNPTPIPKEEESISESKGASSFISDDNIQVKIQGEKRSISTISQNSKPSPKYSMKLKEDATPHIAAMGRLSPDKEDMLEKEMADLLKRGLIEYSDGTWRALQESSKAYTGFATRSGFYQWKYLPMGFKNAGAAFQRQMDTVLRRSCQPS
jgi:hypothetical protein